MCRAGGAEDVMARSSSIRVAFPAEGGSAAQGNRMTADEITAKLTAWTMEHSGHEEFRPYVGMSHASLRSEQMVERYRQGMPADDAAKRKFYKGYQMERDLLDRLCAVFPKQVVRGGEIIPLAFGGLVKGHPDFWFEEFPGDCKSVPLDEHLPCPEEGRWMLPRRVFWQMQAYMLYAPADKALVVYESRETGLLKCFWAQPVRSIQHMIAQKFENAVAEIRRAA